METSTRRATLSPDPASVPEMPPGPTNLHVAGEPAQRPKPLQTLVASAQRLTKKTIEGGSFRKAASNQWQSDAWEMYDLVGEERFLATTLAGRLAQARLYVGKADPQGIDEPAPVDDQALNDVLNQIGGTDTGRARLIERMGVNLFVAGDGWLVGVPRRLVPDTLLDDDEETEEDVLDLTSYDGGELALTELTEETVNDLSWFMLSTSEVEIGGNGGDTVAIKLPTMLGKKLEVDPDEVYMIRVWRPHPEKAWLADSPTRSSLPVLRELVGLTMHIAAQIDSRLAGAGLLVVADSAARAARARAGIPEDSEEDPFTDALINAMITPLSDRSSASSVVPLVITVPDDVASSKGMYHVSFSTPFDMETKSLRDEAIRRLALGQDAPPELLLGVAGMNHWGAWLVREDVVTTHIEPPLALMCDAITTQYLHPVMRAMGYSAEEARQYVVWYDVSHMIVRPNRAADADKLHDKGVITDEALRTANGFSEDDAPSIDEEVQALVLDLIKGAPTLVQSPGIAGLVEQVRAMLTGQTIPDPVETAEEQGAPIPGETEPADDSSGGENEDAGPPTTEDAPAQEPGEAPSGATSAAVIQLRARVDAARREGAR